MTTTGGSVPLVSGGIGPGSHLDDFSRFKSKRHWAHGFNNLVVGLEWLHKEAQVVYRGIRPANIVLHGRTAVTIDFDVPPTFKEQILCA